MDNGDPSGARVEPVSLKTEALVETTSEEESPTLYAWYVAGVLTLAYVLSFIDRKLPFILAESIKRDLSLSDTQLGILTGAMFAIVYSTAAIPIAWFADRTSRKRLIAGAVLVWSALTALGGLSRNFAQLAASRAGVAIGEAACTPASHSLIGAYFSPRYRSRAMGLYFVGSQLGIILGLGLGGWINDLADWRMAMLLLGLPGIFVALLVLSTVKEPPRPLREADPAQEGHVKDLPFRKAVGTLFGKRAFLHLMAAALLTSLGSGAVHAFTPTYLIRTFEMTSSQVGWQYGLISGIAGTSGAILGGIAGDWLHRKRPGASLAFVGAVLLFVVPCYIAAYLAPSLGLFLAFTAAAHVGGMCYAGPAFSTLQSLVPPQMYATATAIYMFALTGIGASLGPLFVGMASDWFSAHGYENGLRSGLIIAVLPMAWAAVHYFLASRRLEAPKA